MKDDSAWGIYERLPPWAREAAKLTFINNGAISPNTLRGKRVSKSSLKEMVHGRYRLFVRNGNGLVLTQLGLKIAAISNSV
jgi:hypothetical protein